MGRAPTFWSEENTKLIQENFVVVSLSVLEYDRTDAVGQFLRDSGMRLKRLEGSLWCVTASGKILESHLAVENGKERFKPDFDLPKALEKFKALPEAERAPGAVKVGEMGVVDAQRAGLTPPAGTLILKLYFRSFMRDGNQLRYLTGKDLWYDEQGERTETDPGMTAPQAQPDHMWLTEAECKSLMRENPRLGDKFPLPAGISDRLVRRHLNPKSARGHNDALDRRSIRAAELSLTVEAVSADKVRLRLDGNAKLGQEPVAEVLAGKRACIDKWGYEPKLLGFLEYDPQKQLFTRFEVVALGDQFGRLGLIVGASRPGCQPLGITFELVPGVQPADRFPPGGVSTAQQYFDQSGPGQ